MNVMKTKEVSDLTGIAEHTLRFWRHDGSKKGPKSFRLGGTICYLRSEVEQWLVDSINADRAPDEQISVDDLKLNL